VATAETASLEGINEIFGRMKQGDIRGRVVLDFREVQTAD
jgi:D-arabinose 1-dehydrogenase-like Zn-dependent alcohol dehydrogenase